MIRGGHFWVGLSTDRACVVVRTYMLNVNTSEPYIPSRPVPALGRAPDATHDARASDATHDARAPDATHDRKFRTLSFLHLPLFLKISSDFSVNIFSTLIVFNLYLNFMR